jgi:hypothetical protein
VQVNGTIAAHDECGAVQQGDRARVGLAGLFLVLVVLGGCSGASREVAENVAPATPSTTPPAGGWPALLPRQPFPYLLPLMEDEPTALDGTYVKVEPARGEPVHCLRCPD